MMVNISEEKINRLTTSQKQWVINFVVLSPIPISYHSLTELFTGISQELDNAPKNIPTQDRNNFKLLGLLGIKKKTNQENTPEKQENFNLSDDINNLTKQGYLTRVKKAYKMPEEIAEILKELISPDYNHLIPLVRRLNAQIEINNRGLPLLKRSFLPLAEPVFNYLKNTAQSDLIGLAKVLYYHNIEEENYEKALHYAQYTADFYEQQENINGTEQIDAYNNLAFAHKKLENYQETLSYNTKVLQLKQQQYGEPDMELAKSYYNIAYTYDKLEDIPNALNYTLKGVEIKEQILTSKHFDLMVSYANIADKYEYLGQWDKAVEYDNKSLNIKQQVLPEDHYDLAISYRKLALRYDKLGKHQQAFENHIKAEKIFKKILNPSHPSRLFVAISIIKSSLKIKEHKQALSYLHQAACMLNGMNQQDKAPAEYLFQEIAELYKQVGKETEYHEFIKKADKQHKKNNAFSKQRPKHKSPQRASSRRS